MPKFKHELEFNIADHDKWAVYQIGTSKDIFDTLDSLRDWINNDLIQSRNTKVLIMPNFSETPIEVKFKNLEHTTIANGTVSFRVYDDRSRRVDVVLEMGTTLIRHKWLDPHTLSSQTEVWIVGMHANNNLVRRLDIKDEWGIWTLENKDKEKK